jgi:CheY-like chemotaxis protein
MGDKKSSKRIYQSVYYLASGLLYIAVLLRSFLIYQSTPYLGEVLGVLFCFLFLFLVENALSNRIGSWFQYDVCGTFMEPQMKSIPPNSKLKTAPIRVLIVDDMPQVREDLRVLLQLSNGTEVVSTAANGKEAIHQAEILNPDAIIVDLEMPIMNGLQAKAEIKRRKISRRVVILSVYSDPETIKQAM